MYSESRGYDALDRLRTHRYRQNDGTENIATYDYDRAGPLLSARFREDGSEFLVQYEYYADLTRKTLRYPSGAVVTEHRDESGRLLGVSDADGTIIRSTSWQGNSKVRPVSI